MSFIFWQGSKLSYNIMSHCECLITEGLLCGEEAANQVFPASAFGPTLRQRLLSGQYHINCYGLVGLLTVNQITTGNNEIINYC